MTTWHFKGQNGTLDPPLGGEGGVGPSWCPANIYSVGHDLSSCKVSRKLFRFLFSISFVRCPFKSQIVEVTKKAMSIPYFIHHNLKNSTFFAPECSMFFFPSNFRIGMQQQPG